MSVMMSAHAFDPPMIHK